MKRIGIKLGPNKMSPKRKCLMVTQKLVTKIESEFPILNHGVITIAFIFSLTQRISFLIMNKGTLVNWGLP